MPRLITLPAEVLQNIFIWLDPADLGSLPRVCRILNDYVTGNWKLFQDVYLNHLDAPADADVDWEKCLHDYVKLNRICARRYPKDKEKELPFVHDTVVQLLRHASSQGHTTDNSNTHCASKNADLLKRIFADQSNRAAFMEKSFLFDRVRSERPVHFPTTVNEDHQRSAKLHCLYGSPILNVGRLRSTRTYPFACSIVYDLRLHTEESRWGPFQDDGSDRVDWEKVEAIMVVLGYNVQSKRFVSKLFSDIWSSPFSGSWPNSYMPSPKSDLSPLAASDPYGVTGTWYRIVCFLDYNDFFNYNFPMGDEFPLDLPRPGISVGEATRLIVLKLRVSHMEPPGPNDGQALPVVHYTGHSKLLDDTWDENANSEIRGTVRLTKEGEVRWTSVSIFHGEERWRSEAVQVGGLRSARGVVGNWFDSDYDEHGPVGPTAFWKASDSEAPYGKITDILPSGFLAYSALVSVDESDPEGEMDYTAEDDEEDDDDLEIDYEMLRGELPALLLDAELDVLDTSPPADNS